MDSKLDVALKGTLGRMLIKLLPDETDQNKRLLTGTCAALFIKAILGDS